MQQSQHAHIFFYQHHNVLTYNRNWRPLAHSIASGSAYFNIKLQSASYNQINSNILQLKKNVEIRKLTCTADGTDYITSS